MKRLEIYGIALALLIFGVWTVKKFSEAKTQARAEQVIEDAKPRHEVEQTKQAEVKQAETLNKSDLALFLAAIRQQQTAPADDERIIARLRAELGPGFDVQVKKDSNLPDAPSSITVTGKNADTVVRNKILDCDATKESLNSCTKTADHNAELLASEKRDHQTTKNELAATQKLVKGTFWGNLRKGIGHAICGGGGTAIGIEVGRKNNAKAGVIIGGAAFAGCEVLTHLGKR